MADRVSLVSALKSISSLALRLLNEGHAPGAIEEHLRILGQESARAKIRQLEPDVKAEVDRLIRDGSTIDQIVAHLKKLGTSVSRSSVGRYKKTFEEKLARYREAQEVASVWVTKLGEEPKGDVGRLLAEMLKTVAFRTLADMGDQTDEDGEEIAPTPKDIASLAKAIRDLESAGTISLDREVKIREAVAREHAKKLDRAVEAAAAAGEKGLSAERLAQLRREFLGVRQ